LNYKTKDQKEESKMSTTASCLDLIKQFPEAFADPEASPPQNDRTAQEGRSPEAQVTELSDDEITDSDHCQLYLLALEYRPDLQKMAANLLQQIALIAQTAQAEVNERVIGSLRSQPHFSQVIEKAMDVALELPETYARETSVDCPSGMCPLDGH
jgi:hypothetical protein